MMTPQQRQTENDARALTLFTLDPAGFIMARLADGLSVPLRHDGCRCDKCQDGLFGIRQSAL